MAGDPGWARLVERAALVCAIVILAYASVIPSVGRDAGAAAGFAFTRLEGDDRFETARVVAERTFASASTAVVARADDFPDALAANYLAGVSRAPILLTLFDQVPPPTLAALADLGTKNVTLVGGEAAISEAVRSQLESTPSTNPAGGNLGVSRIAGHTRYGTAAAAATSGGPVGSIGEKRAALVATGEKPADALAGGALSYGRNLPTLLTTPGALAPEAADALAVLGIEQVLLLGGPAAVGEGVRAEIEARGIGVMRLAGPDRTATAAVVANFALGALGFKAGHVNLARGDEFADALASGPHGGTDGPAPMLLTESPDSLGAATADWLRAHASTLQDGHLLGGSSAVSDGVQTAAENAAGATPTTTTSTSTTTTTTTIPADPPITATAVATGLEAPATFTFAPDGRIFYGERLTGEIRILDPSTGSNTAFFSVPDLATSGEQGLLGLALDPAYPTTPYVYVYATQLVDGVARNQILRLVDGGGTGTSSEVVYSALASRVHNGGIAFGPDGHLYAVVGDRQQAGNSQDVENPFGKVLRMTASGGVPADNPFAGRHVWAYGIRNSFGFAFDPRSGQLWETENGPACNDELNRVVAGGNYGWGPSQTCSTPPPPPLNTNQDGPDPVLPLRFYTPVTAPTGAAFCSECGLGTANDGVLFYGTYVSNEIRKVTLTADRAGVSSEDVAYSHDSGILSVERAPSGHLHFSDGSGIYRLTPG